MFTGKCENNLFSNGTRNYRTPFCCRTPFNGALIPFDCLVPHAQLSCHGKQQWRADRTEAEEAAGKEAAGVEMTATVMAVNTAAEAEAATTAAGGRETTTAGVDAGEAPMQESSTTG